MVSTTAEVVNTSNSSIYRKKSQVFVEIPPSPLFKARVASTLIKVDDLSPFHITESHKENAPPLSTKTLINNIPADNKNKGKRKTEHDNDGATLPDPKKAKVQQTSNDNELVMCHQCRSKKPSNSVLQCTGTSQRTGNRCKASYCDSCLRNRYGKELRIIAKRDSSKSHKSDNEYHFICPRCDGNCNCAPCRKRHGLAPVGKFSVKDGESVREILERNPEASGRLPKSTLAPAAKVTKPSEVDVPTKSTSDPDDAGQGDAKISKKTRDTVVDTGTKKTLKTAPEPVWVSIPEMWSKHYVEDRIHIREFILRFNPILNIGPRNLEELDDFTSLHDPSTKAILLSLLDLLAIEDETHKKKIQETVKNIRSLGLNWVKIVSALYDLRNSMPKGHALSALPDLSLSDTESSYNTRGGRIRSASANQLLPVLLYLIQVAGEGASVRQELEEGYKQAKEFRAAYFKVMRDEQERWTAERAELTGDKPAADTKTKESVGTWKIKFRNAEAKHKTIIARILNTHKPEIDSCAPRFTSLGRDTDGRTYYALSASGPQRGKKERLPSESERFTLRKWGWFIAVYGKPGTVIQHGFDDKDEDEDEDKSSEERWWGFADVEEMRKLSKWLAYCAEVDTSDNSVDGMKTIKSSGDVTTTSSTVPSRLASPSDATAILPSQSRPLSAMSHLSDSRSDNHMAVNQDRDRRLAKPVTSVGMKALAKAVLEFADFIDWRLNRDQTTSKREGGDAVPPAKFYD